MIGQIGSYGLEGVHLSPLPFLWSGAADVRRSELIGA